MSESIFVPPPQNTNLGLQQTTTGSNTMALGHWLQWERANTIRLNIFFEVLNFHKYLNNFNYKRNNFYISNVGNKAFKEIMLQDFLNFRQKKFTYKYKN